MASSDSGVMRAAKRYMRSRQLQKLSWASARYSVRPAKARWKACECRLGMPGSTGPGARGALPGGASACTASRRPADRKSTRLNSSHTVISYAVFCLKKKEQTPELQSHSDLVCRILLAIKTVPLDVDRLSAHRPLPSSTRRRTTLRQHGPCRLCVLY